MSIYAELSYNDQKVEIQEVKGIQFSILSPEEIIKRSVVKITKTDTYTGNEPVIGGLFDSRMGVLEHNKICSTCEQKNVFCPGHFGHIELAKPVFHAMFFDIVKKILKCVCYRCSRILISPHTQHEDFKNDMSKILNIKNNQKRWEAYFKLCNTTTKAKFCGDDKHIGCGTRQPDRYNKEAAMKIIAEWKDKSKDTSTQLEFTAEDVLRIFKRISEEDMEVMGFNPKWNRPEWMICSVLPIPPPAVRPSIIEENGQRREDDLTHKLSDIVKTNNNIIDKINKGASEETIKLITMVLQYHIFTFIDNQIPGLAPSQQRNGRKLKSICDRMRKKDGRIRGNLNGKRVDQSARSVITPDPYISIDELGVPIRVALNITFQEVVNEYNIEEMRKLILNGPDKWPGAKYVKKVNDMTTINLKYGSDITNKTANELKYGDVVHRHLNNGDYVLFNRQPSLHKMSMMCHKVIIMPYQTFRLNVLDTPPYNADFDGDEMNLHCPQNIQTMNELKDLAAVPYLILTPRDGKPSIEVVQDTLVGSFRLTKDYTIVSDKQMANLQMCNSYFKGKLHKPNKDYTYTGRELFSEILPPSLFIEEKNKAGQKVIINNSSLTSGNLDKAVFHNITNGLIPVIYHDYGPIEIKKFLDNTQRLVCRWLLTAGFSIGISDLVTDKETDNELNNKIKEMKAGAYKKLEDMRKGDLENNSIFNNEEFIEREIIGILNQTTNKVAQISLAKIDEKTNRMFNMVKSGSKGKETNIAQIMACVGQQNVDGKRISYGFTDRTLPHFTKYDDGPEARGFVENSFIAGLSPQEVFFHAMGGREGLIDTAVKSITGDTPIIIMENGNCRCVNIGDWIDNKLDNQDNKEFIEYSGPENLNMELLNINSDDKIYIPTGDADGVITWGELTAITRHDVGEILYKITTLGGREVIIPNSKTLLIWNGNQFEGKKTDEVKKGDYVPSSVFIPKPPINQSYVNETFELNRENGQFLGLYLNYYDDEDENEEDIIIRIATDDIEEYVKKWFGKMNIKYEIETIEKTIYIIGNCKKYIQTIIGNQKDIPKFIFNAPEEFIIGFLETYISYDSYLNTENEIIVNTKSKQILLELNTLFNYLGIFCKQDILLNKLIISNQWAKKFNDLFINKNKINIDTYSNNFIETNNVVLDEIINIHILTDEEKHKYNKLYDVTVPSTLNFSLLNGLICVDTSDTGYIERRLVKAMEDAKIYYDNTVRNALGGIIQYIYGEDGMDGTKIETQFLPTIEMSYFKMEEEYNLTEIDNIQIYLTPEATKEISGDTYKRCSEHFKDLINDKMFIITKVNKFRKNSRLNYPIPFNRIINTILKRRETTGIKGVLTDLTPDYILNKIDKMINELYVKDTEQGMTFFHILIRCFLSPKKLIIKYQFTKSMFDWFVSQIYDYFNEALAQPSEMVGIVAAQTIGELGTQMTLDSFHVSGTAAAVKATSGVPRLKEILSATKKTKTPTLIIYMKPDVASVVNPIMAEDGVEYNDERIDKTKIIAMNVKNSIEITKLSDILEYTEIYWDTGNLDNGILEVYNKFKPLYEAINKNFSKSCWVLRMKFNKEKMVSYGLRMIDIYTKLNKAYNKYIDCIYSDDNAEECIFRIRLTEYACKDIENKDEIAAIKAMEHNIVYQVLLKGYKGINKVSLNKKKYELYNEEKGEFDKIVEWVLDTDGTNLMEILSNPNIDATRTISNDIREIYNVLGIEAARNALYNELVNITGEGSMNYRHLSLLIDTMTYKGNLMSIDRHGINRNASSALSKSSFEESVDMLINASIFSEYDNTSGISPQVMLGKVPNCGSGYFDIILDEEHMMELLKTTKRVKFNMEEEIKEENEEEFEEELIEDCNEDNIGFNYHLDNKKEDNKCYEIKKPDIKIV
jgi:DNA-directed RNA polymerase beta' subunit